jgi:signal transduction histidine kinase
LRRVVPSRRSRLAGPTSRLKRGRDRARARQPPRGAGAPGIPQLVAGANWRPARQPSCRDVGSRIGLYIDYRRTKEDLERQGELLRQQEKLATLGTLAAGLAHEINNPMGIIASRIELMLMESDSNGLSAQARDDLAVLQRNVGRVVQIVRGLLSFARQAPRDRTLVDLNLAVEETPSAGRGSDGESRCRGPYARA